uniref:Uncharacterized protein n=1 Tax=Vespula pensylvanica TaxID=30213 RepID=A0A834U9Q1_VESPE|nr:hypothetical protein H0235_007552 [Vespula pensylvanica]
MQLTIEGGCREETAERLGRKTGTGTLRQESRQGQLADPIVLQTIQHSGRSDLHLRPAGGTVAVTTAATAAAAAAAADSIKATMDERRESTVEEEEEEEAEEETVVEVEEVEETIGTRRRPLSPLFFDFREKRLWWKTLPRERSRKLVVRGEVEREVKENWTKASLILFVENVPNSETATVVDGVTYSHCSQLLPTPRAIPPTPTLDFDPTVPTGPSPSPHQRRHQPPPTTTLEKLYDPPLRIGKAVSTFLHAALPRVHDFDSRFLVEN